MTAAPPNLPAPTPLPVPDDAPSLVIFGGSFDPPTRAHAACAHAARDSIDPDAWLVLVPAARSPHKRDAPGTAEAHRLAMLERAFASVPNAAVWTDELDRARTPPAQPSYMIDTVRRLAGLRPGTPRRLLIGADQAIAFHRWKDHAELAELAEPLVMLREPAETPEELAAALRATDAWTDADLERWGGRVARIPSHAGSATEARARAAALRTPGNEPENKKDLDALLHAEVLEYIRQHDLYRG